MAFHGKSAIISHKKLMIIIFSCTKIGKDNWIGKHHDLVNPSDLSSDGMGRL